MLLSCVTLVLAVVCCASAWSEDGKSPLPRSVVDSVLRKVISGQAGDSTVFTVDGNVQFKETIKVTKETATPQDKIENYIVEGCCILPSNLTYNNITFNCFEEVKQIFPDEAASDEATKARRRLREINCIAQCVSYRLGLSEKDGSIMSEEMVNFLLSDNRTASIGISEDMIRGCIDTAKAGGQETQLADEGVYICDTSSLEILKFAKCIMELENLYCPPAYLRHSKYCDKSRREMKMQLRHRTGVKKSVN